MDATAPRAVPVHPERTDEPDVLHWHLDRTLLDHPQVRRPLDLLVDAGVLAAYELTADGVRTRLAPDQSWPARAGAVRSAVQDAARAHEEHLEGAQASERNAFVAEVAGQVLADAVRPVAAAHGGSIELLDVSDGVVGVRTTGACRGCPAAGMTLNGLLQREVRRRVGDPTITVEVAEGQMHAGHDGCPPDAVRNAEGH